MSHTYLHLSDLACEATTSARALERQGRYDEASDMWQTASNLWATVDRMCPRWHWYIRRIAQRGADSAGRKARKTASLAIHPARDPNLF